MPRPRKPRALRLLEGNRSKTRIPDEPLYSGKFPRAPSFIEGIGRREWKRLAPAMLELGVLTSADWCIFTTYCHAVQRSWDLREHLERQIPGSDEWNALDRALNRVEKQLTVAYRELGLSPVMRSRAAIAKPKAVDEFEQFERCRFFPI